MPILSSALNVARGRRGAPRARVALVTLLFAGLVPGLSGSLSSALVRNRCALEQTRDRATPCGLLANGGTGSSAGDWLAFRSALFADRWELARQLGPRVMSKPARMGEALLIREASRHTALGDSLAARRLLDAVLDRNARDPLVWYAGGHAYEEAGGVDRAEDCYLRGIAEEGGSVEAAGRNYLGVLYFRQGRWSRVIETLEHLSSGPIEPRIRNTREGEFGRLPDWSGAFLLLGIAYERGGRTNDAKHLYRRLLAAQVGSGEWKVNRALVSLAALEGRDGANLEASQHFSRALDLTFSYSASFREEYQADTWKQLLEFVRFRLSAGDVERLLPAARAVVDASPRSPGAWLLLALVGTVACQDGLARDAYQRAETLDSAVSPFRGRLEEARTKPIRTSC